MAPGVTRVLSGTLKDPERRGADVCGAVHDGLGICRCVLRRGDTGGGSNHRRGAPANGDEHRADDRGEAYRAQRSGLFSCRDRTSVSADCNHAPAHKKERP